MGYCVTVHLRLGLWKILSTSEQSGVEGMEMEDCKYSVVEKDVEVELKLGRPM